MNILKRLKILTKALLSHYKYKCMNKLQELNIPIIYDESIYKAARYVRNNIIKGFQTGAILYKENKKFNIIGINIDYCTEEDFNFTITKNKILTIDPYACIITYDNINNMLTSKYGDIAPYLKYLYKSKSSLLSLYKNLLNWKIVEEEKYKDTINVNEILNGTEYYRMCKVFIIQEGYPQETVEMVKTINDNRWVYDDKICKIEYCLFSRDNIKTRSIIGAMAILDGTIDKDYYGDSYVVYY